VAKQCEIGPELQLITNKKSHTFFQMRLKSWTVDVLEGQYCNRNSIGCSKSSLATAGLSCLNFIQHFKRNVFKSQYMV